MSSKKAPPKRLIEKEDIDRIMAQAPDYILSSNDEIKDLYVASEWAKEERDISPYRYYDIILNEGTEEEKVINIDFQQTVNVGSYVKTNGGGLSEVRSANARRLHYLKLDRVYQQSVLALNKAMGIRSRKPRNIVDYTPTILEMFGKFYTISDVHTVMSKEYKIKVPENELKKFFTENRELITRRRAEYVLNNKEFRVATETGRLEVLNQMLTEVEIRNKQAGGSNVDLCNLIIKIIEQARKEVKGNEVKMTVDGRIDINATLHAENNIMDVMSQMSINTLVIGLTSAKAGLNPAVLISQLANSWYSKFNGFSGNIMDGETVQLPSALIKQYNWDDMRSKSSKFVNDFRPISEIVDVTPEEENRGEDNKLKLLNRLRAMKMARDKEDGKANPHTLKDSTSKDLRGNGLILTSEDDEELEEPKREFEIDYALNKHYPQKKGMRIRGAMRESIARHKAKREEGELNINKLEKERRDRNERRRKRREAKRKEAKNNSSDKQ